MYIPPNNKRARLHTELKVLKIIHHAFWKYIINVFEVLIERMNMEEF